MRFHSAAVPVALFTAIPAAVALLGGVLLAQLAPPDDSAGEENPAARAEATPEEVSEKAEDPAESEKPAVEDETALADLEARAGAAAQAEKEWRSLAARRKREENLAALRATVEELTRTLGPGHEETLAARRARADRLQLLGRASREPDKLGEEAAERRAVLALVRHRHGEDDPATFQDWEKLARSYYYQDKSGEMEKEYRGLIAAMGRQLGPEDKATLAKRYVLARDLLMLRQYAEAEREFRSLIATWERNPGDGRPLPRDLRYCLAYLLDKSGQHAEAEIERKLRLAALEEVSGPTDREVLLERKDLAKCLLAQGKADAALRELEFVQAHWVQERRDGGRWEASMNSLLEEARQALAESEEEKPAGEARE